MSEDDFKKALCTNLIQEIEATGVYTLQTYEFVGYKVEILTKQGVHIFAEGKTYEDILARMPDWIKKDFLEERKRK